MLRFPDEFFDDEVREGFYVSGIMKRVWAAELELLQDIDKVCRKLNIRWFAAYGTLLGAVRHEGFIPWDDDIDICMLREDYNVFVSEAKHYLPEKYQLMTVYNDSDYHELFAWLTNTELFVTDEKELLKFHDCVFKVGIDIFPLDNISDDCEQENARNNILRVLGGLFTAAKNGEEVECEEIINEVEEMTAFKINESLPAIQRICQAMDQMGQFFSDVSTQKVSVIAYYMRKKNYICDKKAFASQLELPFENIMIKVPIGYEKVLQWKYGDYARVYKSGGDHQYPFFTNAEELLKSKLSRYYFAYKFAPAHLSNQERIKGKSVNKKIKGYIDTIEEMLDSICRTPADNLEELLVSYQGVIIEAGTYIEQMIEDSGELIHYLEAYCEGIYQVHCRLIQSEKYEEELGSLNQILKNIKKQALIITEAKDVLFIPYRARYWKMLKPYMQKELEEGNRVHVMPVPYYKRNADGTFGEEYYDIENYSKEINCLDFRTTNLEQWHPERIYIQNPYDECNYTTSVAPYFYASNIKGFTDELIYVPFFKMDEITVEKERQTMQYFCTVPGVVHSDRTIVQSEEMMKAYVNRLVEMSGEEYRDIWEKKIVCAL